MAYCPECNAEMPTDAVSCEACGYEFPKSPRDPDRTPVNLAYGWLADAALLVGMIAAALGCFFCILGGLKGFLESDFATALIGCPIAFMLCLANLVVLVRVSELKPGS